MKLMLSTLALIFTASVAAQWTNESAPFHLVLASENPSYNGETLSACHTGAAIESLCLSHQGSVSKPNPIAPAEFYFNTSDSAVTPNETLGQPGILTCWLRTTDLAVPSAASFYIDPTANIALPLLYPGTEGATVMNFDQDDNLNVQGYIDYANSPPTAGDTVAYYRWYGCPTYYAGYQYVNLVWALGSAEPETPSCVKVAVKRVFI